MQHHFIPLSVPNFSGKEKEYVNDAVVSEWVSTGGSKIADFEKLIAQYVKSTNAVACANGTSGLHLAMLVAGVGEGDEVICPTLTFIAAINPIRYANAQPIFIGCDETLCISPKLIEEYLQQNSYMDDDICRNKKTNAHIKAISVVHVFGNMADMPAIMDIAKQYNLVVIEDATEALGTYYTSGRYEGKFAGTIGDVGVYSFNGNKLITTGSGGMLTSTHEDWAQHAQHLSTQAKSDEATYKHDEVGYNYRMTNLQAALGLAQMEQVEGFIAHKQEMYDIYKQKLDGKNGFKILPFVDGVRSNKWFFSLCVQDDCKFSRDEIIAKLKEKSIGTRPIWGLIQDQADYGKNETYGTDLAKDYLNRVVNLPCSTNLPIEDVEYVCDVLLSF